MSACSHGKQTLEGAVCVGAAAERWHQSLGRKPDPGGRLQPLSPPPQASAGCKEGGKGLRQVVVMLGVCCNPPKNRLER